MQEIAEFRGYAEDCRRIASTAMHAAAEPVLEAAKQKAPVLEAPLKGHAPPGTLRDSLVIKDRTRSKRRVSSAVETRSGAYAGAEFYGSFIELGHKHGKRRRVNQIEDRKQIPAQPFLRPAFDEQHEKSLAIVKRIVEEELAKITTT